MSNTILQINYHFTSMADLAKLATPDTAEGIAAVSGLVWKTWLLNEDGREAGGYLVVSIQVSLAKLRAFALSWRCDRNTSPRTGCTDCTGEITP